MLSASPLPCFFVLQQLQHSARHRPRHLHSTSSSVTTSSYCSSWAVFRTTARFCRPLALSCRPIFLTQNTRECVCGLLGLCLFVSIVPVRFWITCRCCCCQCLAHASMPAIDALWCRLVATIYSSLTVIFIKFRRWTAAVYGAYLWQAVRLSSVRRWPAVTCRHGEADVRSAPPPEQARSWRHNDPDYS